MPPGILPEISLNDSITEITQEITSGISQGIPRGIHWFMDERSKRQKVERKKVENNLHIGKFILI